MTLRRYEDRNGNKRTAVEVVAERAFFAGSKSDKDSGQPAVSNPTVSYSSGEAHDFTESNDSDDLPF